MAIDPGFIKRLYRNAWSFHDASGCLDYNMRPTRPGEPPRFHLVMPKAVLLAFSAELLLKCLIAIVKGETAKKHRLTELFGMLPDGEQLQLRVLVDDALAADPNVEHAKRVIWKSSDPYDCVRVLEQMDNVFVDWRYAHEHASMTTFKGGTIGGDSLVWALSRRIDVHRPELLRELDAELSSPVKPRDT